MWIKNIPRRYVEQMTSVEPNTVLISINDPGQFPAETQAHFVDRLTLHFLDLEEDHEFAITPDQANEVAHFLCKSYSAGYNVLVHCNAGVCRSGAVAQCGAAIGYELEAEQMSPNLLVKRLVMKELTEIVHEYGI